MATQYVKWTVGRKSVGHAGVISERQLKTQWLIRELNVSSDNEITVSPIEQRFGKGEHAFVTCTKEEAEAVVMATKKMRDEITAMRNRAEAEAEQKLLAFLDENAGWINAAIKEEDDSMVFLRFTGAEGPVRMTVIMPTETSKYMKVSWYTKDMRYDNNWSGPTSTTASVETEYVWQDGKIVGERFVENAYVRAIARMVMREQRID